MSIVTGFLRWHDITFDWLDKATKKHTWTKADQEWYDAITGTPFGYFADVYRKKYERDQYMSRYGLDYSDIVQPWKLPGSSEVGSYGTDTLNYVSDNIKRLYK